MIDRRKYVEEQIGIILGRRVSLTNTQVTRFWDALARTEERDGPRDLHGNFPAAASVFMRDGQLEYPPLHPVLAGLAKMVPGGVTPRWPEGKRFAACLTHDVDRIVERPWRERWRQLRVLGSRTPMGQRLRWALGGAIYGLATLVGMSDLAPFDWWVDEEARHGFHSTFFVLPEHLAAPTRFDHYYRYADTVRHRGARMAFMEAARAVAAEGWEIGLHGSYASAYDAEIYAGEKARLEGALGKSVTSGRQHFLRFDAATTPGIHAGVGIRADSTLGYSNTIGCRAGLAFPYFWPDADDLLEAPLTLQDVALLRAEGKGLGLDKAVHRAKSLIERIAEAGGVVVLSWHTHPESPGAHQAYRDLLDQVAELDGWGCSLCELDQWWRARRTALRSADDIGDCDAYRMAL